MNCNKFDKRPLLISPDSFGSRYARVEEMPCMTKTGIGKEIATQARNDTLRPIASNNLATQKFNFPATYQDCNLHKAFRFRGKRYQVFPVLSELVRKLLF